MAAIALICCASPAWATDSLTLTVNITAGASVAPGGTVEFEIVGTLSSDTDNEGVALFGVDMSVTGPETVNLSTAASISAPTALVAHFVSPDGLNNPTDCGGCFGFGGTADGDNLVQIGGGQNTINNDAGNAPYPVGEVLLDVGQSTGETVFAEGTLTAPSTLGEYNINLSNGFANVIRQGETGPDVYATEAVVTVNTVGASFTVEQGVAIESVGSVREHTGVGDLLIDIDLAGGLKVEPREGGIQKLEVVFDTAMNAATTIPANVSVIGCNSGAYSGTIGTSLEPVEKKVLTITFDPALADVDVFTVDLAGMESEGGGGLADSDFEIVGLQGDVDRNETTATTDASLIKPFYGQTTSQGTAAYDFDCSGLIATTDGSLIKPYYGNQATCP